MTELNSLLAQRLALLSTDDHRPLLTQGLRGIERETLRVNGKGLLANTPHPQKLGSALTQPQITTDYAEALLEFITPAEHDIALTLEKLDTIHRFAYANLGDELLWSQSMPCTLPPEEEIAIAWYGTSNPGMLKHVYRRGLALRYGKTMQCIAGIHYNYSLPEKLWQVLRANEKNGASAMAFQSESYIAMIRNFRRYSWLLMYLFGASPALSTNFLHQRPHQLATLSSDTLYLPFATSLRMSDLGYQNDAQAELTPQENSLESYVQTLSWAVNRPYPPYEKLGTKRDGEWIQLSHNVLQIENEYYSSIRPKRITNSGERPIQALCRRGIQYVEVRCMDVDPFKAIGISLESGRFLDAFLLFCALDASAPIHEAESREHNQNFALTVKEGRRPGLTLRRRGEPVGLREWGLELLEKIRPIAALLDAQTKHAPASPDSHATALERQAAKLANPDLTPSARVLAALRANGNSFAAFGLQQSLAHAEYFRAKALTAEQASYFGAMAETSLAEQAELERTQSGNLDAYIEAYQTSTLCKGEGEINK